MIKWGICFIKMIRLASEMELLSTEKQYHLGILESFYVTCHVDPLKRVEFFRL